MEVESDVQESVTITFEWTLKALKTLFDSTKGDTKSKVTKSVRFGGGRWQILFYANAGTSKEGTAEGGFVSLYLSCEPTLEEKEAASGDGGKWVRDGVYKFSFELRNLGKTTLYNQKEAHNHSFSHKTANWGWAQFARRDSVYYQSNVAKTQDAFVIICTITSTPSPPVQPPPIPRQLVPKGLLDTVGALLDDPLYSDVEFIIAKRGQRLKSARRIWAARRLLERAEYFETMFSSGFAEGSIEGPITPRTINQAPSIIESDANLVMNEFEDSDDEDDENVDMFDDDADSTFDHASPILESAATSLTENAMEEDDGEGGEEQRNVRAKLSHPSSPRSSQSCAPQSQSSETSVLSKMTVVVKDVAYKTYFALLYYIYTDMIVFAPLSSSFVARNRAPTSPTLTPAQPATPSEPQGNAASNKRSSQQDSAKTRREWIQEWQKNNPGRPAPCSAKAAYRLADRLDLRELKERASQHIFKSLTVENIAFEVFSPFSAAFDEIRQVQINFFLTHWQEIRESDSMRDVWQQIRNGRHPGFEEVWPLIASQLEFKPTPRNSEETQVAAGDVMH